MNRRTMFSRLIGVGATGAFAGAIAQAKEPLEMYRGYRLMFTDWKGSPEHIFLCAQWVAVPIDHDRLMLGVNLPNLYGGPMEPGFVFNLTILKDRFVGHDTPHDVLAQFRIEGLIAIRRLVDTCWDYADSRVRSYFSLAEAKGWEDLQAALDYKEPSYKFGFTGFKSGVD